MNRIISVLLTVALAAPVASAQLWTGDFETGDLSQWTKQQWMGSDRIKVVEDPVAEGRYAARIIVRPGDDPIGASGNRNELVYTDDVPKEGEVRWYRWSVLWPSAYRSADAWQIFTQWHHWTGGGSPPLAFYVRNDEMRLGTPDAVIWTAPFRQGVWREFVFGVRWSTDRKVGWVEIELDGEKVLPRTPLQTLLPGTGSVYLKQGLYRSSTINFEQRLFVDGMTIGKTRDEVLPPVPVPEPEPEPELEPELDPEPEPEPEPFPLDDELVISDPLPDSQGEDGAETQPEQPWVPGEGEVIFGAPSGCSSATLPASFALLGLFWLGVRRRR